MDNSASDTSNATLDGSSAALETSASRTVRSKVFIALRAVVFILIAAALFVYLNNALILKGHAQAKGTFDSFYDLQRDTVDVLYVGTSATNRYFVSPLAFHESGLAVYTLGPNMCPAFFLDDIIREGLRTQSPQLLIVELRPFIKDPYSVRDASAYKTLDVMDLLSPNRIAMSQEAAKYCDADAGFTDYLFPVAKYHDRVIQGEITKDDLLLRYAPNTTQGYQLSTYTLTRNAQAPASFTSKAGHLSQSRSEELDQLLDYCDTLDVDILFVMSPFSTSDKISTRLNSLAAHVEERGYEVLNFNNEQSCADMGIDWKTDFFNDRHVNYLGAEKYTAHLMRILKDRYDLPDRRGDEAYGVWESGFDDYRKFTAGGIKYHGKKVKDEADS